MNKRSYSSGWQIAPAVVIALALLCGLVPGIGHAGEKEWLREWKKALEEKVREKVQEVVGDKLIRYDKKEGVLAFSPLVLRQAAALAQKRMTSVKKISLTPEGDHIGFLVETLSGGTIGFKLVPEALEIDAKEMAFVARMPEGIDMKKSEAATGSIMSFFDSLMGISEKISLLSKNVAVTGESLRFRRPVGSSALARVLKTGEGADETVRQVFPLSVQDGWLRIGLKSTIPSKRLLDATLEILLEKLKTHL